MAYLAKANKPDLLEICGKIGIEVDPSTKVVDLKKKKILKSPLYDEEEVKIILDRILNNRKEEKPRKTNSVN